MQRSRSFPLITKPRLSNPAGLGEGLEGINDAVYRLLTWTCTQSPTNYFAPTKQRGCQSLWLAKHKEVTTPLIHRVGKLYEKETYRIGMSCQIESYGNSNSH